MFGTGAEPIGYVQPIFLATDDSLGGYRPKSQTRRR